MIAASLRLAPLSLLLLLGGACDPDALMGGGGTTDAAKPDAAKPDAAKAEAKAAAKKVAETKKAAADDVAVCMAGCTDGHAQSPTDRETCRLSCGVDRGPSASTTVLARFDTCLDSDCTKASSATNAATCRLTCAQAALSGAGAPALADTARGCAVSCLEQTGVCEAACRGNPDDVATCKLLCTSVGERCLQQCEADPSKSEGKAAAHPTGG